MLDGRKIKTESSWDRSKQLSRHERGYGTAWDKLRKSILIRDQYLCQVCLKNDKPSNANQVDHIIPKSQGGTDDPENLQSICDPCHKSKTLMESIGPENGGGGIAQEIAKNSGAPIFISGSRGASYKPDWLPIPRIPIVIVCGPPGSGKSTFVKQRASSTDLVLDLDEISAKLSGKPIYTTDMNDTRRALRYRNAMLASLGGRGISYGGCYLIVTAKKREDREWWKNKLKADVVLMSTPKDECKARVLADHRRSESVKTRHLDVIDSYEYE